MKSKQLKTVKCLVAKLGVGKEALAQERRELVADLRESGAWLEAKD